MSSLKQAIEIEANKELLKRQKQYYKSWKPKIRWINGYMYKNTKLTQSLNKVNVTVDVPWAEVLDSRNGIFKDSKTLLRKMKNDWDS